MMLPVADAARGRGEHRYDATAGAICAWIDQHLPEFLAPPTAAGGLVSLDEVKCAGELLLVVFALTAPWTASVPALRLWARRIGWSLRSHLHHVGDGVDWARLPGRMVEKSSSGGFLMLHPLLAAVTGRPPLYHAHAIAALRAAGRLGGVRALDMDVRFALQLSGGRAVRPTMREDLLANLHACCAAPRARISSEYSLTHAIFYLTEFGRRAPRLPAPVARRLTSYLAETAAARVAGGDLDIAAELLFSQACVGGALGRIRHEELHLLANRVAPSDGSSEAGSQPSCAARNGFQRDYHLLLVTLLAVARGMAAAPGR
jgi:Domain of unknown function (DUF6895)